jgi:hypothetical protein
MLSGTMYQYYRDTDYGCTATVSWETESLMKENRHENDNFDKQAGAELCQAQVKLG